jgi:UDP-glucose 4-epimerase
MNVFITGGGGFIGFNLISKLIKDTKYMVTVYGSKKNIVESSYVRYIDGNILDYANLEKNIEGSDIVIHLAAIIEKTDINSDPIDFVKINIIGSLHVFNACIKHNITKIINLSSSSIYNDGSIMTREHENISPDTYYGLSKYSSEQYLRVLHNKYKFNYVNIRTSIVYGFKDNSSRVLNKFINNCNNDRQLILFKSDNNQILDYIHVLDVCSFIIYCLTNVNNMNETLNISGHEKTNVKDLANTLKNIYKNEFNIDIKIIIEDIDFGKNSLIKPTLKRPIYEIKGCSLSNEQVYLKTTWFPKYNLYDGILEYINSSN